eukprot:scaffold59051_cov54-Phaeocystis_antarctica.AAC.3
MQKRCQASAPAPAPRRSPTRTPPTPPPSRAADRARASTAWARETCARRWYRTSAGRSPRA